MTKRFLFGFAAVAATAAPFLLAQGRRFSADDLPKIVRIGDPQISPDGKIISIVVGRANLKEDRYDSEIDFVDVASKSLRVMTHGRQGVGGAHWSPSGDSLAFLASDADKKAQIWVMPLTGGDPLQVTHSKTPVSVFAWRPDGQAFAYAAADEVPERKDEAKYEDAFEVGNNSYLTREAASPVHIWTVGLSNGPDGRITGKPRQLTNGSSSLPVFSPPAGAASAIAWTPDAKSILFVRAESPITGDTESSRLELLDVATGDLHALTKSTIAEGNPEMSPDGTMVAYGYPREGKRRNEESVYLVSLNGASGAGVGRNATGGIDHAVGGAQWMPDGKSLLVAGPDGTSVHVWMQPLDGPAKMLDMGSLSPSPSLKVGRDGSIAFTATTATHPPELFYMAHPGEAPVQMTHLQTVTEGMELGKQETLTWKSDQFTVDGVLTYPPAYTPGSKLPLVLYLHGGPTATSFQTFSTSAQILAGQGWLVFEPNYRGSDNLGNFFEASIVNDASAGPGRDIMAGVKVLEARGLVEESKIAVSGWSYGGQMTAWLIGNYPTVWKAAVAGAPVTDLVDQYTLSDNNIERAAGYGPSPFIGDNLKSYAVQSPISYAYRVKTPTLIMSDVGDWRVTTTQAYKLYHALRDNNVPVKFIAFPVPGHSPADPIRSRDVWRRWTLWLDQYLGGPGLPPAPTSVASAIP